MADAEDARRLIDAEPAFAGLVEDDRAALAAIAHRRRWPAGSVLFHRGDAGRDMVLIASGRVRISVLSADGRELSLRHAEAGALLGEIAVLDGGPRSADATAATDSEGFVIAKSDLDRLIESRPSLARAVIELLCLRLRATTDQLEAIALYRLEVRLARFLLGLVSHRSGGATTGSQRLPLALTQGEIADILGASRPKVNGAFSALETAGAIVRTPDGVICRMEPLGHIAAGEAA